MSASVTIKDVAALAGVSYQTVSRALNQPGQVSSDTLKRVREAMQELRWEPSAVARSLRSGRRS